MKHALICAALLAATAFDAKAISIFSANASNPGDLAPTVDAFRDALGERNDNVPENFDGGRRQINWDAAPAAVSDPNPFPGDFFNQDFAPRARGIEFQATGTTSGFELSSDVDDNGPAQPRTPLFGNGDFQFFSPERIFRQVGGDTFDVAFYDPANPDNPALSAGLGVVFLDIDFDDSTKMEFFGAGGESLLTEYVEASVDGGLSFLGAMFSDPIVSKVSITVGETAAMDDFIFGEPTAVAPVPLPAAVWLLLGGLGSLAALKRTSRRNGGVA